MAHAATPNFSEPYYIRRTDLTRFIIISAILHAVVLIMHGLLPAQMKESQVKPPIKVQYIPPEPPKKAKKPSTLIDAPEPRKVETPRTSELLASHDSRAHSNPAKKKAAEYRGSKTVVPKLSGQRSLANQRKTPVKRFSPAPIPLPEPAKKSEVFPLSDKGFITRESQDQDASEQQRQEAQSGSAMALLDGFDASKYAKFDTGAKENAADDEVISLDTTETKYASYFARIKHQIERVWNYPEEAARRGISGELTLRFQIQRDGDLMEVRLIEGSGSELLDFAALRAIKNAAPFYPFPVTIEKEKISILATFIYSPSYGAAHRRR